MGRFGGMIKVGASVTPKAVDAFEFGGRITVARLAELVQLTLVADAAIIDLRPYAERQRAIGAAEYLETGGILLPGGKPEFAEAMLWQLADPIEAGANGFPSYAGAPLHDAGGALLGRVVALQRGQRSFDGHDLKILRTVADIVADLVERSQPAS